MSNAAMINLEREALKQRGIVWPPRDASAMAAPSRRVVDLVTRKPLGLSVPADEPTDDIEVDDGEERDEGMSEAREAELIAWRNAQTGGNRGAFLSDIDILIERALKQDRKRTLNIFGQVIGEVIGEIGAGYAQGVRPNS